MAPSEPESLRDRLARRRTYALGLGLRLTLFFFSVALVGCRSSSSPSGEYRSSWIEPDQSTVDVTLTLGPDGKAAMQRTVRWPDGRTEADSWTSEYRAGGDQILIGSDGKIYALFRRQGRSLIDPSHLVNGKPIRLERKTR